MPVDARRFVRKMRGGAQAHLLGASDGHFYVVKFLNNPQHRRILVNEWIASVFMNFLGLSTPPVAMIRISEQLLAENPEIYIQLGQERRPPPPGWHFGSRFPGDPSRSAVYDFLPDALLEKVENLAEFPGVLAFDQWIGNADARQAVFFRARIGETRSAGTDRPHLGFAAQMVDNGYVLEGPHWRLTDSPLQGLYFRPVVYRSVRSLADFEPWLERIRYFPEEVVDQAVKQIPPGWLEDEAEELERLLVRLLARRKRVPDLIEACRKGRANPFPAWGPR
ncbi:MAG TPA: HipA family kinase [Bryobacteraceae bacterium]|nr:HipA family kinase [Bryobacteraceae bacterium]